jgi:hypothetical protein
MEIQYLQAVSRRVVRKEATDQSFRQNARLRLQPRLAPGGTPLGSIRSSFHCASLEYELTFQSGHKVMCEYGRFRTQFSLCPGGRRVARNEMQKVKIAKIEISKLKIAKVENLKTLTGFFPRDRSRNCFPQDRILVPRIKSKAFASSLLRPCPPFTTWVVHTYCEQAVSP